MFGYRVAGFGAGGGSCVGGGDDVTSYSFDGNGDYLSIPDHADWDLTSDMTFELFTKASTYNTDEGFFWQGPDANNRSMMTIQSGGIRWMYVSSGSIKWNIIGGTLTTGSFIHIAFVLEGTTVNSYIAGARVATVSSVSGIVGLNTALLIGRNDIQTPPVGDITANFDEIRISNTARYSGASYTVPTVPFVCDANTKLLIHCGETITSGTTGSGATFTDSGNTGHTVTEVGNAIRDTVTYKF